MWYALALGLVLAACSDDPRHLPPADAPPSGEDADAGQEDADPRPDGGDAREGCCWMQTMCAEGGSCRGFYIWTDCPRPSSVPGQCASLEWVQQRDKEPCVDGIPEGWRIAEVQRGWDAYPACPQTLP